MLQYIKHSVQRSHGDVVLNHISFQFLIPFSDLSHLYSARALLRLSFMLPDPILSVISIY